MSGSPQSLESLEYRERVNAERARQRRNLARLEALLALVLVSATLPAWENHPRVVPDPSHPGLVIAREVSHTAGYATLPAGPLIIALAIATLVWSSRLAHGTALVGWISLGRALVILGVMATELVQLLLGRRNWLNRHSVSHPVLAHAVGAGVWLGLAAAVGLLTVSCVYLWRVYGSWRDRPATPSGVATT
ncbi:MAG: hypothetical protein KGJ36_01465 [Acidobacteriota bacterium]|nr:hypothetical protein [Acidobacteriota bacterium]